MLLVIFFTLIISYRGKDSGDFYISLGETLTNLKREGRKKGILRQCRSISLNTHATIDADCFDSPYRF